VYGNREPFHLRRECNHFARDIHESVRALSRSDSPDRA
jgi:hypothetical protein